MANTLKSAKKLSKNQLLTIMGLLAAAGIALVLFVRAGSGAVTIPVGATSRNDGVEEFRTFGGNPAYTYDVCAHLHSKLASANQPMTVTVAAYNADQSKIYKTEVLTDTANHSVCLDDSVTPSDEGFKAGVTAGTDARDIVVDSIGAGVHDMQAGFSEDLGWILKPTFTHGTIEFDHKQFKQPSPTLAVCFIATNLSESGPSGTTVKLNGREANFKTSGENERHCMSSRIAPPEDQNELSYFLLASDGGNVRLESVELTEIDKTAPSQPTKLRSTGQTKHTISLKWVAGYDEGTGPAQLYYIYRNGVKKGEINGTKTGKDGIPYSTFVDTGLKSKKTYKYQVTALDSAGNESLKSKAISVTTK